MSKLGLLKAANKLGLGGTVSRWVINDYATTTPPRPRPFSMWSHVAPHENWKPTDLDNPSAPKPPGYVSDYTSWPSLVDRRFSGRHLRPQSRVIRGACRTLAKSPRSSRVPGR